MKCVPAWLKKYHAKTKEKLALSQKFYLRLTKADQASPLYDLIFRFT